MVSPGSKPCPYCGSLRGADDLFCGQCGKQLGITPTIPSGALQQGRITRILNTTQPIYTPEPTLPAYTPLPTPRSPTTTKLLVVIGVLVVLLIGSLSFALGQTLKSNSQTSTRNTPNSSNQQSNTHATPTVAPTTPTPTATPSPTPTPTPSPTPTPEPKIYRADWSSGMGGWTATNDWHIVNGMLVNDGTQHASNGNPTALAPYPPQDIANYSVQAEIRLDKYTDAGDYGADSFGIAVRYSDTNGGYKLGACASAPGYSLVTPCDASDFAVSYVLILSDGDFSNDTPVKKVPFQPGSGKWHTYRIDVQGNTITVWLDGGMVFQVTDDKFLSAGQVGLWSDRCQISIRSFTITAL